MTKLSSYSELSSNLIKKVTTAYTLFFIRFLWQSFIQPVKTAAEFENKFKRRASAFLPGILEAELGQPRTKEILDSLDIMAGIETVSQSFIKEADSFNTFGEFIQVTLLSKTEILGPFWIQLLRDNWEKTKSRLAPLSSEFVSSLKDIYIEYMLWLQKHPEIIDRVAWQAFEKIVAEIFASRGFEVELVGRLRNRSADIMAIRVDEFGVETKYLIECKRYSQDHPIGMNVINGVIGAASRANVGHSFLVTSGVFSAEVRRLEPELKEVGLYLRDGDAVKKWLQEYSANDEKGLWLAQNWDDHI